MKRSELKIGEFYTFSTKQIAYYDNNTNFLDGNIEKSREVRGIGRLNGLRPAGLIKLTLYKKEGKKVQEFGYIELKESEIISKIQAL